MHLVSSSGIYDFFHNNARELISEWLDSDKRRKGWICPLCGNGSGKDGDGLVYNPNAKDPGYFHCFVCGFDGDLVDLIGKRYDIPDYDHAAKIKKACEILRIEWNEKTNSDFGVNRFSHKNDLKDEKPHNNHQKRSTPDYGCRKLVNEENEARRRVIDALRESLDGKPGEFTELAEKAHFQLNNVKAGEYISSRGISPSNPFLECMGYLEDYECGIRLGKDKFKGCIAFFGSNTSYVVRDIFPISEGSGLRKVMKPKQRPDIPIGLLQIIQNKNKKIEGTQVPEPVFVVEGLFDAPSIAEAGADAISLNGTSNVNPIIWAFKEFNVKRPLLLAFDNDEGGNKGLKRARDRLERAGLEFYEIQFCKRGEDPNEFLVRDRDAFTKCIKKFQRLPIAEFENSMNRAKQNSFRQKLVEQGRRLGTKTGFKILDGPGFLDGGLHPGLYVMGAISSLGKTTFALQMADQIATEGKDVVFFTLEMPEIEIMGKSVSRYTLKGLFDSRRLKPGQKPREPARSLYEIYRGYSGNDQIEIERAITRYFNDTGDHLRIIEGVGDVDADTIRRIVDEHTKNTGEVPVVFIDYLQLLMQPRDGDGKRRNMTDKQIVDANIFKLKRISRDYGAVIFGISSFNRDNYNEPVSMRSFKESGAIEYSSDVLIGLEPDYMKTENPKQRESERLESKANEDRTGMRTVRLVILKNRNGKTGGVDLFTYYPKYNCYFEKNSNTSFGLSSGLSVKD